MCTIVSTRPSTGAWQLAKAIEGDRVEKCLISWDRLIYIPRCWLGRPAKLELTGLWMLCDPAPVAAALVFDAINGFHDAANSIATVVFDDGCFHRGPLFFGQPFSTSSPCSCCAKVARHDLQNRLHPAGRPSLCEGRAGRVGGGHRLGPADLVVEPAHQLLSCPHRRICRRRHRLKGWGAVHWDKLFTG